MAFLQRVIGYLVNEVRAFLPLLPLNVRDKTSKALFPDFSTLFVSLIQLSDPAADLQVLVSGLANRWEDGKGLYL